MRTFLLQFELDWLVNQYDEQSRTKPMHLVVGQQDCAALLVDVGRLDGDFQIVVSWSPIGTNRLMCVQVTGAPLPTIPFGTHHTKMTLLHYEDGLRVVISTANMTERDWTLKTQGVRGIGRVIHSDDFSRLLLQKSVWEPQAFGQFYTAQHRHLPNPTATVHVQSRHD